jgi:hypothetical protein
MSAGKNPTTPPPLKAEHDSKIAGRNSGRGIHRPAFSSKRGFISRVLEFFERKNQKARDLPGVPVIDCNG